MQGHIDSLSNKRYESIELKSTEWTVSTYSKDFVPIPGLIKTIVLSKRAIVRVIYTAHICGCDSSALWGKIFINGFAQLALGLSHSKFFVPMTVYQEKLLEKGDYLIEARIMSENGGKAGVAGASLQITINEL